MARHHRKPCRPRAHSLPHQRADIPKPAKIAHADPYQIDDSEDVCAVAVVNKARESR